MAQLLPLWQVFTMIRSRQNRARQGRSYQFLGNPWAIYFDRLTAALPAKSNAGKADERTNTKCRPPGRLLCVVYCIDMAEPTLASIEKAIQTGFAAVAEDIADLRTELSDFRNEFNDFRNETNQNFRDLRAEVADLRRDVEELRDRIGNVEGYAKEIDLLMSRISVLEQKVGISK
ncbi:hypothetical protein [Bradyrhizobium manausense]|nr:hypothetical protein [Bradyrhizobium manausense]